MSKPITKEFYNVCRKKYKEPIILLNVLYNAHCDTNMKIPSIGAFESHIDTWMRPTGHKLVGGCLTILKYFDSKFA